MSNSLANQLENLQKDTIENQRRIAMAFQAVFGQVGTRNSDQQIVWSTLCAQCGQDKALPILDKEGRIDPASAVFYEGARRIFIFIEGHLKVASASAFNQQQEQTKPRSVKR